MGGASQVSVFTIPSRPKTGQRVAFVARADDPARTARIELWVDKRKVKACKDSVCMYQGGPFPAGRVAYAANAFDKGGNRTTSGWQQVTIRAVDTQPPVLQVQHRPGRPATNQKVTILGQDRRGGWNILPGHLLRNPHLAHALTSGRLPDPMLQWAILSALFRTRGGSTHRPPYLSVLNDALAELGNGNPTEPPAHRPQHPTGRRTCTPWRTARPK